MGLNEPGTRLNLKVEDKPGTLAKIVDTSLSTVATSPIWQCSEGSWLFSLRNEEAGPIVEELVKQGLTVKSVAWQGRNNR